MTYYTYHINSGWKEHNDTDLVLIGYKNITKLCIPITPPKTPIDTNTITIENLYLLSKSSEFGTENEIILTFELYNNNKKYSTIKKQIKHGDIFALNPIEIGSIIFEGSTFTSSIMYLVITCDDIPYIYTGIKESIKGIFSYSGEENIYITFVGTSETKTSKYPKYEYPKVQPPVGYKYNETWQTIDGRIYDLSIQPTEDITLYPHYEPIYKTISFTSTGLENDFTYDYSVKINDHIIFSAPTHKYYKFSQWSNGSSNSKIDFIIGPEYFTTDENISFTASYINDTLYPFHTLTLDTNKITYRNDKIYLPANYNNIRVQYWKPQNSSIYFSPYLEYNWGYLSKYQRETFIPIYMGEDYPIYPLFFKDANDNWIPINNLYEKGESEWK